MTSFKPTLQEQEIFDAISTGADKKLKPAVQAFVDDARREPVYRLSLPYAYDLYLKYAGTNKFPNIYGYTQCRRDFNNIDAYMQTYIADFDADVQALIAANIPAHECEQAEPYRAQYRAAAIADELARVGATLPTMMRLRQTLWLVDQQQWIPLADQALVDAISHHLRALRAKHAYLFSDVLARRGETL